MRYASIVTVMAAILLVSSIHSQETAAPASKDQTDESVKKVKELQEERLETLAKVVDQVSALFRATRATIDDVWEAQRVLVEARLDATETDEERVGLHERLVALLKSREKYAEGRAQAGLEIQPNALKAKARRLEAEIHLEQVKIKLAKPAK